MPPTGSAALGNRPDHLHIGGVRLEMTRNANRPVQFASREPLAEWRTQPIPGIRQHTTEANAGRNDTIDLRQGYLRLRARCSIFGRNTRSLQPSPLACPTLGKKQPQLDSEGRHGKRLSVRRAGEEPWLARPPKLSPRRGSYLCFDMLGGRNH